MSEIVCCHVWDCKFCDTQYYKKEDMIEHLKEKHRVDVKSPLANSGMAGDNLTVSSDVIPVGLKQDWSEQRKSKQDLVQVLANINLKCIERVELYTSFLAANMIMNNNIMEALGSKPTYTAKDIEDFRTEFHNNIRSMLSIIQIVTSRIGIEKPKSIFTKIIDWFKKPFGR